jgi:hypothetical protein
MPEQKSTTTELERIVQNLIDSGESAETIEAVIKEYEVQSQAQTDAQKPYTGPSTFAEGVLDSLTSGEAAGAGAKGGLGFLKGATLDIPSSAMGALRGVGNLITNPKETIAGIPEGLGNMWEIAQQAGTDPEAFGRMMGQITGQPLVTAGLARGAPGAARAVIANAHRAGPPLETVGGLIRTHGGITGFMPPFTVPRYARLAERMAGRGIEEVGRRLTATKPVPPMPQVTTMPPGPTITSQPVPPQTPPPPAQITPTVPQATLPEFTATRGNQPSPGGPPSGGNMIKVSKANLAKNYEEMLKNGYEAVGRLPDGGVIFRKKAQ